MEASTIKPSTEATALSLPDLFVSRPAHPAETLGGVFSFEVDAAFAEAMGRRVQEQGWLPDAYVVAAWLLLQSRWLGTATVGLHETLDSEAGAGREAETCGLDCTSAEHCAGLGGAS